MYGPCQHTVVGRVWWVKRPPCSLLERIRFRRTAVSKHVHEKKSYNCSSKNCSNILHVQTQNCWQKFSHVLRDCHVKLSSQEIKAYHTGVRRDFALPCSLELPGTHCEPFWLALDCSCPDLGRLRFKTSPENSQLQARSLNKQ